MPNPKKTITLSDGTVLTLQHTFIQHDQDSETTLEKHIYMEPSGRQHIKYFSYPFKFKSSRKEPKDSLTTDNK